MPQCRRCDWCHYHNRKCRDRHLRTFVSRYHVPPDWGKNSWLTGDSEILKHKLCPSSCSSTWTNAWWAGHWKRWIKQIVQRQLWHSPLHLSEFSRHDTSWRLTSSSEVCPNSSRRADRAPSCGAKHGNWFWIVYSSVVLQIGARMLSQTMYIYIHGAVNKPVTANAW